MFKPRRHFLKTAFAAALGLIFPAVSSADLADFFASGAFNDRLKKIFTASELNTLQISDKFELTIPSIAENGAVVPLTATARLENVEQLFVFVEKNPVPLAAIFELSPDVEPTVSTRLKMAETTPVVVIAKAEGQLYQVKQAVKVTLGGCGG